MCSAHLILVVGDGHAQVGAGGSHGEVAGERAQALPGQEVFVHRELAEALNQRFVQRRHGGAHAFDLAAIQRRLKRKLQDGRDRIFATFRMLLPN